ncbi:hypothetical protein BDV95DRAFT_579505 [Massariosphaeria phaeospora]|uniref:Prolyl 4-hydroxylase alpha subunit domain-containing protein n=1 Tax=Massariosphaeria phaeospora TaxID=100035 RepID=A0A7C8I234_9PLEO|nr:hypothetical protein BDV95DRAFT_579505 [Massariosphaeria phaeospora]
MQLPGFTSRGVRSICDGAVQRRSTSLLEPFVVSRQQLCHSRYIKRMSTSCETTSHSFRSTLQQPIYPIAKKTATMGNDFKFDFMEDNKNFKVPDGFLDGPAPDLQKSTIDWAKTDVREYDGLWAVVLDGVLSQSECDTLVAVAEASTEGTWERAMVNIGNGRQAMYEDTRKCGRIIYDSRELAAKIWARIEAAVPEIHTLENWADVTGIGPQRRDEVWKVTRLNERMRFLKYIGGEYFRPHGDGCYETPDRKERSYFTLHLYLNDAEGKDGQEELEGGATTFHALDMIRRVDVVPKAGRVLMFQHRSLLHSGDDVISGTKYTMRSDLMYRKDDKSSTQVQGDGRRAIASKGDAWS